MTGRSGSSRQVRILAFAACLLFSAFLPDPSIAQERSAAPPQGPLLDSPGQDNAAAPPGQDNAASLPAQDNAAVVPALDNATSLPAQDNAAAVPALDNTTSLPAQDNAAAVPALDNATSLPAQDNAAAVPALDNAAAPVEKPAEDKAARTGILDRTHDGLVRGILRRVIWFDNFFGRLDETEDPRKPDFLIRWRNSVRAEEGGDFKYRSSIHGRFVLPRISKRVRLFISGETEAEPSSARLPEDPGQPGFDRTLPNTRLVNTEVRYIVIENPTIHLFAGTGVRLDFPVEFFTRTRIRFTLRPGEKSLARLEETLFWKSIDEGFGQTTQIELDRLIDPKRVLRWTNSATITEVSQGVEWGSELSWFREFSPRSAITLAGGAFGDTEPVTQVETYRILVRYRRNFLRPWLFYELEPEVSWPREADGSYPTAYAFTARLEIVFQGTAAMTEKKVPKAR